MRVYSHPVKYVAEDGEIRDISLELKADTNGSFVNASHEIKTVFEKDLANGITLAFINGSFTEEIHKNVLFHIWGMAIIRLNLLGPPQRRII